MPIPSTSAVASLPRPPSPPAIRIAATISLIAAALWLTALTVPAHADGDPSRDIVRAVEGGGGVGGR